MPTSFIIFILVILKSCGSRLMNLKRYFSKALDTSKVKRKNYRNFNYCVPTLTENRKQVIISNHQIMSTIMLKINCYF